MNDIPTLLAFFALFLMCIIGVGVAIVQHQARAIQKKRQAFKPSVIKNGFMFYSHYVPEILSDKEYKGFPVFTDRPIEAHVFTDYDQAVTILDLVQETNPKSKLVEI